MKRLILFLLVIIYIPLLAQSLLIEKTPVIQTTTVDSIVIQIDSTYIYSLKNTNPFAGCDSGVVIFGPGVPEGTYIIANTADSLLTLSAALTDEIALGTLNFVVLSAVAYSSGDWLGLAFEVYDTKFGGCRLLQSIVITDSAGQLGNTDVVFIGGFSNTLGLDNAALAVPAGELLNILGYISLTTAVDLGTVHILEKDAINMALPRGKVWARLISKGTPMYTSLSCLKIYLRFTE